MNHWTKKRDRRYHIESTSETAKEPGPLVDHEKKKLTSSQVTKKGQSLRSPNQERERITSGGKAIKKSQAKIK